ncbi:MAG: hypothetical protein U0599_13795 [Vicinamibacteria bacterium]
MRLLFQGAGPRLRVSEVFAYGPDAPQAGAGGPRAGEALGRGAGGAVGRGRPALRRGAVRLEPHRASHHAAWARARWRAAGRRWLDVESLDDGGPQLVETR